MFTKSGTKRTADNEGDKKRSKEEERKLVKNEQERKRRNEFSKVISEFAAIIENTAEMNTNINKKDLSVLQVLNEVLTLFKVQRKTNNQYRKDCLELAAAVGIAAAQNSNIDEIRPRVLEEILRRLQKQGNELTESEVFNNRQLYELCQYWTRHWLDGYIIEADDRIENVAGYHVQEVLQRSAFDFMAPKHVRIVDMLLRQMLMRGHGTCVYQLKRKAGDENSKNLKFIYLKTSGFLDKKVDGQNRNDCLSFVCLNELLSEAEGKKAVDAMEREFANKLFSSASPNDDEGHHQFGEGMALPPSSSNMIVLGDNTVSDVHHGLSSIQPLLTPPQSSANSNENSNSSQMFDEIDGATNFTSFIDVLLRHNSDPFT